MLRQSAGEAIWQQSIVVLLQAIGRVVLRVRSVRAIRVLQRIEAVTRRRQSGAGSLEGLELQQRAGPGRGGRPRGSRRRRVLIVGRRRRRRRRHLLMMIPVAATSLLRHYRVALAATSVQPFIFRERKEENNNITTKRTDDDESGHRRREL